MRPTKVTTETAIPTVFQVEFAEAAETGTEEVGEGEDVNFQEVMSDVVEPIDDEIVRVPVWVDRTTAGLVGADEVGVRVCMDGEVDETAVDDAEEVG